MTLQEIREKKFPRAFKGYSDTEVDAFMAQVGSAVEKLEEEINLSMKEADALRTRLAEYEGMDREMRGALLAAQRAAREIVEEARDREKTLLEEAQTTLEKIEQEIEKQQGQSEFLKKKAQGEIETLKAEAQAEMEEQKSRAQEVVDSMKKRVQEEADFMKNLVQQEVGEMKNRVQEEYEREKETLDREIGELVSMRTQVRVELESMLKGNIEVLSARLQALPEPGGNGSYTGEETTEPETTEPEAQEAQAPEPEEQPEDPAGQAPQTGCAPYSLADIPGADGPDGLPKLDFQG